MRITFDSVEELKTFCRTFRLEEDGHPTAEQRKATDESLEQTESAAPRVNPEPASKPPAERVARKSGEKTQVERIRTAIEGFCKAGKSFSANDVLEKVLAGDRSLNFRSVLTGISKLMNTEYAGIPFTEEPGKGPRPVKVYHPG